MRHAISDPDPINRTGTCSVCGPVKIYSNLVRGVQDWRCSTKSLADVKARHAANPDLNRESRFLRIYGITIEEYDRLLAEQDGLCARCHQPPGKKRLAVDHCHITNVIRGLLCGPCNTYLGRLEANRDSLITDLDYIDKGVGARPILEKLGPA